MGMNRELLSKFCILCPSLSPLIAHASLRIFRHYSSPHSERCPPLQGTAPVVAQKPSVHGGHFTSIIALSSQEMITQEGLPLKTELEQDCCVMWVRLAMGTGQAILWCTGDSGGKSRVASCQWWGSAGCRTHRNSQLLTSAADRHLGFLSCHCWSEGCMQQNIWLHDEA